MKIEKLPLFVPFSVQASYIEESEEQKTIVTSFFLKKKTKKTFFTLPS